MKTWMKAIPLVAGLAFMASALATPARADDDDRRRGDHIQLADHKSHGKHYGHKGKKQAYKQGYHKGKKRGYRHGRKHGYRDGHRDSKHAYKKGYKHGKRHSYKHGKRHSYKYGKRHSYKHGGHRHGHKHRYGHRHHSPSYGHRRRYVPYPAFVFRYYHESRYEAPAERRPHAQPVATPIAATTAARDESLPETCLMTREYQTEITVGGEVVEGYGEACLQPDGSWYRGPAVAVR